MATSIFEALIPLAAGYFGKRQERRREDRRQKKEDERELRRLELLEKQIANQEIQIQNDYEIRSGASDTEREQTFLREIDSVDAVLNNPDVVADLKRSSPTQYAALQEKRRRAETGLENIRLRRGGPSPATASYIPKTEGFGQAAKGLFGDLSLSLPQGSRVAQLAAPSLPPSSPVPTAPPIGSSPAVQGLLSDLGGAAPPPPAPTFKPDATAILDLLPRLLAGKDAPQFFTGRPGDQPTVSSAPPPPAAPAASVLVPPSARPVPPDPARMSYNDRLNFFMSPAGGGHSFNRASGLASAMTAEQAALAQIAATQAGTKATLGAEGRAQRRESKELAALDAETALRRAQTNYNKLLPTLELKRLKTTQDELKLRDKWKTQDDALTRAAQSIDRMRAQAGTDLTKAQVDEIRESIRQSQIGMRKEDASLVNSLVKIGWPEVSIAPGVTQIQEPPETAWAREQAMEYINRRKEQYGQVNNPQGTGTAGSPIKWAAPKMIPVNVPPSDLQIVVNSIQNNTFDTFMSQLSQSDPRRAQAKQIYRAYTNRQWTPSKR